MRGTSKKYSAQKKREMKDAFLEALKLTAGVQQPACEACGVDRKTIKAWRDEDPEFAQACEDTVQISVDFAEQQLMKRMEAEDTTAIIFFLKCKGKDRGYIEKQKIEAEVKTPGLSVTVTDPEAAEILKKIEAGEI